jgi:hypothetical protein
MWIDAARVHFREPVIAGKDFLEVERLCAGGIGYRSPLRQPSSARCGAPWGRVFVLTSARNHPDFE